jgi:hypothetical protein
MSGRHLPQMLLRLAGCFIAVVGVWAVLAWNPALCVVPAIGCASPAPGQTSSCVPPIPTCTNQYVPLRIGLALLSVTIGVAMFLFAWRRGRERAPRGTLRTDASGAS